MAWKIVYQPSAKREFGNLDRTLQKRIEKFINFRLQPSENPRSFGHGLTGNFSGHWRYRVGDYRIVCRILDQEIVIELIKIAHPRTVYN